MDQSQPNAETPRPTSFLTRATNVFSSPGELYTEVASAPVQTSSWLLPLVLSLVLVIVIAFALYNNPSLRQHVYDMQEEQMKQAVDQGKMTQEQMDLATDRMESAGPGMFVLFGGGSIGLFVTAAFFVGTLIVWLAAKFVLKSGAGYAKMLEIFGLASLIGVAGSVVTLLLMNVFDSMHATPGGALLLLNSFDRNNMGHKLLASVNLFTLWQTGVLGVGLSKISNKSSGTALGLAFGLWLLWAIVSSAMGWVR